MTEVPPHPAKWSQAILDVLPTLGLRGPVLDPFAGVGAGRLAEALGLDVVGLEIEPLWAAACPLTVCGDALRPPFAPGTFRSIVTSCTYGNRMADHHDAKERCKPCAGTGKIERTDGTGVALLLGVAPRRVVETCPKCEGVGRRSYKRLTYRHQYGRPLHDNNSGAMPWGDRYREFHAAAWAALVPLLADEEDVRFVLNVKDSWKTLQATKTRPKQVVRLEVTAWHTETIEGLGWSLDEDASVDVLTPGMRFGANREVREEYESVLVFQRDAQKLLHRG